MPLNMDEIVDQFNTVFNETIGEWPEGTFIFGGAIIKNIPKILVRNNG